MTPTVQIEKKESQPTSPFGRSYRIEALVHLDRGLPFIVRGVLHIPTPDAAAERDVDFIVHAARRDGAARRTTDSVRKRIRTAIIAHARAGLA